MKNKNLEKLKKITGLKINERKLLKYFYEEKYQERFMFEFKKNNLLTSKKIKILNVGAGRGGLSANLLLKNYNVDSLEYNSLYCDIIKWRFNKLNIKGKIINSAIEDNKIRDKYDFVILTDVIEHVFDPIKSLKCVYDLLGNEGKVYITVPTKYHLVDPHYKLPFICFLPSKVGDYFLKIMGMFHKEKSAGLQSLSEMNYYSYNEFNQLAKKIGFLVLDIRKEEILNPEKYVFKKSQIKYYKLLMFFKKIKISFVLIPFFRLFFGHKFVLVKK